MSRKVLLASLASLVILSSCNRQLISPGHSEKEKAELKIREMDFEFFSSKSKIEFRNERSDVKATANMRIRRDSLIWIQLSATLGLEAARCLISMDSIIIVDRVNKEYQVFDYASISEKFHFDIDYHLIQSILLGETPKEKQPSDAVQKTDDYFILQQETGDFLIENYFNNKTMLLDQVKLEDMESQRKLQLSYGQFDYLEEYIFPFKGLMLLEYFTDDGVKHKTTMTIDYSKAEVEDKPLRFPFNIPQKYTKRL
ncbi:MAG: DUF4292 domain-containing protein [Bacteroidota bacterium]